MLGFGKKREQLKKARVAVLAADGVDQTQLDGTIRELKRLGAETFIISTRAGKLRALRGITKGASVPVDLTIDAVHPASFAALVLPGGIHSTEQLRLNDRVREFVRTFDRSGKPIIALGHAGWILASAGVLDGRRIAALPTIADDLRNAGAHWVDASYAIDDNLLTGRSSRDLRKLKKQIKQHVTANLL